MTPKAEIGDHYCTVAGWRFLLQLVDLLQDDIEATMAFDGAPSGISDGLPGRRRLCLGSGRVSGGLGLENPLGAVEMLLVPSNRKYLDPPACLPELVL